MTTRGGPDNNAQIERPNAYLDSTGEKALRVVLAQRKLHQVTSQRNLRALGQVSKSIRGDPGLANAKVQVSKRDRIKNDIRHYEQLLMPYFSYEPPASLLDIFAALWALCTPKSSRPRVIDHVVGSYKQLQERLIMSGRGRVDALRHLMEHGGLDFDEIKGGVKAMLDNMKATDPRDEHLMKMAQAALVQHIKSMKPHAKRPAEAYAIFVCEFRNYLDNGMRAHGRADVTRKTLLALLQALLELQAMDS